MISHYDLEYKENLFIDLYLPESEAFDLLVYFHGGGLTSGSRRGAKAFAKDLSARGIATASVEYRMYPNAKFPDFIDDGADAILWIKENISRYGNCKRIFVGGSSAGGYISMMLCFDGHYLKDRGISLEEISGYIHDAGQPTAHFNVLKERGIDSRRVIVDETAPLYFVGLNEIYPPMLFVVSDNDMFARYEQMMLMIKTLAHFGHTSNVHLHINSGKHCEYVHALDEHGKSIFADIIIDFLDKV